MVTRTGIGDELYLAAQTGDSRNLEALLVH